MFFCRNIKKKRYICKLKEYTASPTVVSGVAGRLLSGGGNSSRAD
jgi:hypothetical protein